jgi:hypothetical protein
VAQAFYPNTWEAEPGRFLSSRLACSTEWVPGQPGLHRETQSQKNKKPPNPDTIAYASKILLKGPWYTCLVWGYTSAWQIQKWMLTVIYKMELRAPIGGARESTQGAEGVCDPISGTTIWTNQYPLELVSLAAYVSEDGLVGHQWEERPLGLANFICPSTG